jgi:hypothetical protein
MLRRPKHSKNEVVTSEDEEDAIPHSIFRSAAVGMTYFLINGGINKIHDCYDYVMLLKLPTQQP